jgi:hypothetical protein
MSSILYPVEGEQCHPHAPDDASGDYELLLDSDPPQKRHTAFGDHLVQSGQNVGILQPLPHTRGRLVPSNDRVDTVEEAVPRALRKELLRTSYTFVLKDLNHNAAVLSLSVCCPTLSNLATLTHGAGGQHVRERDMTLLQQEVRDIVGAVFA